MSERSTLLIGGSGFIGSHLVPLLLAQGRRVTIMGRNKQPRLPLPEEVKYISADYADLDITRDLLAKHAEVIHLAYATVPNTSYDNPLGDLLENLPACVQLFSLAAESGSRLMLVSSGGTVYGEAQKLPIPEDHPTAPISPYGVTKLTLEKYARLYFVTHGLDVVCVRPANAFGEGQRPFIGQGFIATAMGSVLQGKAIRIFGTKGSIRDYLHVSDMAAGILAVLERGKAGEVYNLGSGMGHSNLEVVKAMAPLLHEIGHEVRTTHAPERPFDVQANILDCSRLRMDTGWTPKVDFADGLKRTRDWLVTQDV